ncbi:MAG TPA: serine/threonine-protein kinase [Candidatus Limnocylindrales bacterium]|jgi:serine/threonine-protein kinase
MAKVGDRVANYVITGIIGRGAMATVFKAHDERLNRDVALKLLDQGYAMDFIFRARFEREYRVTALLHHDHIVPVYDAGAFGDQLYIAMMLVDGPNLAEVMRQDGPLSLARTTDLVGQIADALDEAHAQRVIHRDVKPANVLLAHHGGQTGQEHVYVADFGLTLGMEGTRLTRTGGFMGTLAYTAPEQLNSAPIDGRADQYALAATTYQMLTGELPFKRDNEMATVNAQLFDPPPKVTDLRPDLPARVDDVIAKGMAKRPEDRYRTTTDFAKALAVANNRAYSAPTVVATRASGGGLSRASVVAMGAGLLLALIGGGALAFALLRGQPTETAPPSASLPAIAVASPGESPSVTELPSPTATSIQDSPLPTSSATPTRTPRIPPPTPPPTTPAPTPTAPPAGLPLVTDGSWSVDNSPTGGSGTPYVNVGEHRRRYLITSQCFSVDTCRLNVNTFDADTGKRLGAITFKWDGTEYAYRGGAQWYSREGGSSCQTAGGDVITNAYSTHEEVHVAPTTPAGSAATQMIGTKTISGTPTAAGTAAGCAPFEMTYNVVMNAG